MREKGFTYLDILKPNETGFKISCGIAQLVVTLDSNKSLSIIDHDHREYITLIAYISTGYEMILSVILISKVNILHNRCTHNNIDSKRFISTRNI